jgi:hypothetical protein
VPRKRPRPYWAPEPPDPPAGFTGQPPRTWMIVWARVIAPPSVKSVGAWCAHFADYSSGADIWPGVDIFQKVTGLSDKPVRDALKLMRSWGLIWRYYSARESGIEGDADIHRLTFPDDISAIPMLSPDWDAPLAACGQLAQPPVLTTGAPRGPPVVSTGAWTTPPVLTTGG